MANLVKSLMKEAEKGNTLIAQNGDIVNSKKVEAIAKKSYLEALKKGDVDFSISYEEHKETVFKEYNEFSVVIDALVREGILIDYKAPQINEPIEETA